MAARALSRKRSRRWQASRLSRSARRCSWLGLPVFSSLLALPTHFFGACRCPWCDAALQVTLDTAEDRMHGTAVVTGGAVADLLAACEAAGKPAAVRTAAAAAAEPVAEASTIPDPTAPLYHLVPVADWEALDGKDYYPATYEQDGFTHLTHDPALLLPIANMFYTDIPGKFIVLKCDPARFGGEVKFEPAAPVGDKKSDLTSEGVADEPLFPHLYGCISSDSVDATLPVVRGDGPKGSNSFVRIDFDSIMYLRDD